MKEILKVAALGLMMTSPAAGQRPIKLDARASFRQAVEDYQVFVVARCAPDDVQAYAASRAKRDEAFVRSLRGTPLATDYKKAVADRAVTDSHTAFHCFGPPPPPPPLTQGGNSEPIVAPSVQAQQHDTLAKYFAGGDRQFEEMVHLRDVLIGPQKK